MSGSLTNYTEARVLDHITGKASFTMPTVHVALFTVSPGEAGGGTEANYTSYARVTTSAATWNSASGSGTSNAAAIVFPTSTGGSNTIVAFGAYDASSGGNLLWYGPCSLVVLSGNTPEFPIGQLALTAD